MNFLQTLNNQLTTPQVRDLFWAIFSPNIINTKSGLSIMEESLLGISQESLLAFQDHLRKLDKNPERLLKALSERKPKRIGDYFEQLIHYALSHMPCCHKIEHNTIVSHGQQNVGEFDFLFYSDAIKSAVHWEVSVKFYLLSGTTNDLDSYIGVNPEDNLEIKVAKMKKQQKLSRTSEGRRFLESQSYLPIQYGCLLKGYLFYKLQENLSFSPQITEEICPKHLHGWWDHFDSPYWKERTKQYTMVFLPRFSWLSPCITILQEQAQASPPFLVACLKEEDGCFREVERGMVVPANWPCKL